MTRLFFILLFLLISGFEKSIAQTIIFDETTKLPISHAIVYDSCGVVVDSSDKNGMVKLKSGGKYSISHLGYELFYLNGYDGRSSIELVPTSYGLKNVTVGAKKKKYYNARVYYRSIEDVNGFLKYFQEGIVDVVVDTKNNKVKKLGAYGRKFILDSLANLDKKRSFFISDDYTAESYMASETSYENILRSKRKTIDSEMNILYDEDKIGTYTKHENSNEAIISVDELFPKTQLLVNLFGFNQVLKKNQYVEVYQDRNLDEYSVYDVKALCRYRQLTLKHKKEPITKDINVKDEAFVICSEFSDSKENTLFPKVTKEYIDSCRNQYPLETVVLEQLPKMQRMW